MSYIGNQSQTAYSSLVKQDITGNGTPNYTLSYPVSNEDDILLYINNVKQEGGSGKAFTASGTTLTLSEAIANTDSCYVQYIGLAIQTVVPPDGSVSTAKIVDSGVSTAKIADNAITQAKLHSDLIFVPSGMIMPFGGSSAPTGFLACDGSAISRTTYSTLFTAIATTWGVGDGSGTFNLPDLRAMFLRGTGTHGTANMAKGTDFSAPAVGTIENDQMQDHKHQTIMSPGTSYQTYSSYAIGNNAYGTSYNFNTTAPQEINSQGTPRTGDETRPVNASVLYVIKT